MSKTLKILLAILASLALLIVAAVTYLNFVYLPQKVSLQGIKYLEQKSKGQIRASSIQYLPLKGVEIKDLVLLSPSKQPIIHLDTVYLNVELWPLFLEKNLEFRLSIYPSQIKQPLVIKGRYQIVPQKLDITFSVKNILLAQNQNLTGKLSATVALTKRSDIELVVSSPDLNAQGNFTMQGRDLNINKFSGVFLGSSFDFIGDVQNLGDPTLNIYGNLDIDLAGLKKLNPAYLKPFSQFDMDGHCLGELFLSSQLNNPQAGLKLKAGQIRLANFRLYELAAIAELKDRQLQISKCYGKLYDGEINLEGTVKLNSPDWPAKLNLNLFNVDINKVIMDLTERPTPIHGRLFSLTRASAPLKDFKAIEGKSWMSISGSNILQVPVFSGVAEVLRLPELSKIEFKEASGNFAIGQQTLKTDDFKISSEAMSILFKGNLNFNGDLGFDVQPNFSPDLLASSNIGAILGMFIDSTTGGFLGEIKLKGNIKEPRYTFKPLSANKIIPKGIEEGLRQLFKFKKQEDENQ